MADAQNSRPSGGGASSQDAGPLIGGPSTDSIRRDVEMAFGTDIVDQDKLEQLAERIWQNVPPAQRPTFRAEDWQYAIHAHCAPALATAEQRLEEHKTDERMHAAKIRVLRNGFAQQVVRAMSSIAAKYRSGG